MQIYTWDREGFERAYKRSHFKLRGCGASKAHQCGCKEVDITYSRLFFEEDQIFKIRANNIVNELQLTEGSDIFVAGCALGLLMEELKTLGMNVWGCDDSHYIQTIKNREKVKFPIHNISLIDTQFTNKIRRATGAMWFDVVITEDLLTSHDSYDQIFEHCDSILNPDLPKTHIVHIVDHNAGDEFAQKSMDQWSSHNNTFTWLNGVGEK